MEMNNRRATRLGRAVCGATLTLALAVSPLPAFADNAESKNLRGGGGLSEPLAAQGDIPGSTEPNSNEHLATTVALLDSQTTGALPLVQGTPKATLGTFVSEGLVFEVNEDGVSVSLVGIHATDLKNISVPTQVVSGSDIYTVTALKNLAGGGGFH